MRPRFVSKSPCIQAARAQEYPAVFMIRSAWVLCLAIDWCLLSTPCLRAADDDDNNPLKGHLIDCGTDKVVVFSQPASPNGRYTVGWTLRPNLKQAKAVDWSKWSPEQSANLFLEPYNFLDPEIVGGGTAPLVDAAKSAPVGPEGRGAPYELLDVVVDLKKKTFLPLRSAWPYWPGKNHGELAVVWNSHHAVIVNQARFFTMNVWLVTMDETGMRERDLRDTLNDEVVPILKAKRPLTYNSYGIDYWPESNLEDLKFSGPTVHVPFSADIPKSGYESVLGVVSVDMASGRVVKSRCPMKRDNPFLDNPELAKADSALNKTYQRLLSHLDKRQCDALIQEQCAWLAGRDYASPSDAGSNLSASVIVFRSDQISSVPDGMTDDYDGFNRERDQSLIKSTKERTEELKKRLPK
jgi:uncharacterized protein YecT (DUF1311 family)